MNICFLHAGFSHTGGVERMVSLLLNAFAREGEYGLLSLEAQKLGREDAYEIHPAVRRVHFSQTPVSMTSAILKRGIIGKIRDQLKKNQIDIVIGCGAAYFPAAVLGARLAGCRSICWEHTNPAVGNEYRFQKQIRAFGRRFSDANVLITARAKEIYEKSRKHGNYLIYNPVDREISRITPRYDPESTRIISVGRICYAKNYDRLVDIASRVLPRHPRWHWDICGDGPELAALRQKAASGPAAGQIHFLGNVSDVWQRYGQYAFLVMTSRYEGFPMVLLEAAAMGLPLVSFDIETGPREIIREGENGFLIPPEEDETMIRRLDTLTEDPLLRQQMSQNARSRSKDFSLPGIVCQWKALFEEINHG